MADIIETGQGPAKPITAADAARDAVGYTHPYLHRRISTPPEGSSESIKKYKLGIYGLNSYRTVETVTHDEESTTSEIP